MYISKDNSTSTSYPDLEPSEHPHPSSLLTQHCPASLQLPRGFPSLFKRLVESQALTAFEVEGALKCKNRKKNKKRKGGGKSPYGFPDFSCRNWEQPQPVSRDSSAWGDTVGRFCPLQRTPFPLPCTRSPFLCSRSISALTNPF